MKKFCQYFFALALLIAFRSESAGAQELKVDICIYGASSSGVIAAYTAKMMGKTVVVVEPTKHIGGLTTGGLGFTDIGNKSAITGLARDFYRKIGAHYGVFERWIFEPHVASKVFDEYIRKAEIPIFLEHQLGNVRKLGKKIQSISVFPTSRQETWISASVFLDCSYEGDLMAKAGVSYTYGRESNSDYGETLNGVQLREKHQFPDGIDPYKIPGDPSSGLLWGISPNKLDAPGTGDKKIQAYNFRICLTNNPENRIPITRPDNYDSSRYELLLRYVEKFPPDNLNRILKMSLVTNNKTDINNQGPFSTDMIGMNYDFPEADFETRKAITKKHEDYTRGLLYFIGHDQRIPSHIREEMLKWGYPKDEYVDNGHWTPQMYIRECRRMIGEYVMTQDNCVGKKVVTDGVGMAAYTMDSHNTQRLVVNGQVKNEGDVQVGGFGPYPISYRSITPKFTECENLLVPVCLSATHIAYGSIRMEPVFMVLGQSAAIAAHLAIESKQPVQKIDVKRLQEILKNNPLVDGTPGDVLVDNDDKIGVKVKGAWGSQKSGGYGPSFLVGNGKSANVIEFSPQIKSEAYYDVYYYYPMIATAASRFDVVLKIGTQTFTVPVERDKIKVLGQTKGEWFKLGRYRLSDKNKMIVTVSTIGADGDVVADAVLLVPEGRGKK